MEEIKRPKVGTEVMIFKDGKILIGKRKGSDHGNGEYKLPGGHFEYMESLEECVRRETLEETGVEIKNPKFLLVMNQKFYAPKHYINVGFTADWAGGEPKVMEPEKCDGWAWYDVNNLPAPLFKTLPLYIEAYKTGRSYFDN
jgi:8-oxo-dGTP diphosphatase